MNVIFVVRFNNSKMIPKSSGNRIIHVNVAGENNRTRQIITRKVQRQSDATAIQNYIKLLRLENKSIEQYLPMPSMQVGVDHNRIAMLNRDIVTAFRRTYIISSMLYIGCAALDTFLLPRHFCKDLYIAFVHQIPYISLNFMYSPSNIPIITEISTGTALPRTTLNTNIIVGTIIGENSPVMYMLNKYLGLPTWSANLIVDKFKNDVFTDNTSASSESVSDGLNISDIPSINSGFERLFSALGDLIYRFGSSVAGTSGVRIISDTSNEVLRARPLSKPSEQTPLPMDRAAPPAAPPDSGVGVEFDV